MIDSSRIEIWNQYVRNRKQESCSFKHDVPNSMTFYYEFEFRNLYLLIEEDKKPIIFHTLNYKTRDRVDVPI
jgi:hypothetical protein